MKLDFEANIFPVISAIQPEASRASLELRLSQAHQVEQALLESVLGEFSITIPVAEYDAGLEYSTSTVENYSFVITRRFFHYGEWHVGGANGEILNVYTYVSQMKSSAQSLLDLLEYRERGGQ
jgi:hypothetical protein